MHPVIAVANVGKRYASYASNLHRFANWFGARFEPKSEFWANRGISFSLGPGEALALIGQNGAGKSTLLKMLTGTVRPTTGTIGVAGKISAILELGIGFNPEFTGRQNILNAGGLIGHSGELLESLMPQIEAFAELGEFFDKPLRVYSSGMQARLAFSLATAVRPDVLIIDEVLSVGDSYFQHKSFNRVRQFKDEGTSIILVTHGLGDVRALCDRVILLDKGQVLRDGPPDEVVDYYNALIAERENANVEIEQLRLPNKWTFTRSGSFSATIDNINILDQESNKTITIAQVGQDLKLVSSIRISDRISQLVLGVMLRDRTGHIVWGTNTWHTHQVLRDLSMGETVLVELCFKCNLGPGSYSFSTALTSSDTHLVDNYDWQDNAVVFDVVNSVHPFFVGSSALPAAITMRRS